MKKLILIILIVSSFPLFAGTLPSEKARGLFLVFGVGPRFPISSFSNQSSFGYGFDAELDYTDNEYLPVFLFAKLGFQQFPGSQTFYQSSDYSNYSINSFPLTVGVRYFFSPLLENVVLFMPIVEVSAAYNFTQVLHQFKSGTGRSNFVENNSRLGLSGGVGISMFLLEVMATYNYFQSTQYVGIDLKVRLPLYIAY
ncbi:MAG TPA: hypothetical protein VKD08_13955 [Ignavibacteriaceae bacterium]|jgi:hypothetical protein|nr:hypothetical protein [Ignavibacteriaceae bacterium]